MEASRLQKLKQMLEADPSDSFLLHAIGMEYLGLNQLEDAENHFRKCIELDSVYFPSIYQLALLLYKRGENTKALSLLEAALPLLSQQNKQRDLREFQSLINEIQY